SEEEHLYKPRHVPATRYQRASFHHIDKTSLAPYGRSRGTEGACPRQEFLQPYLSQHLPRRQQWLLPGQPHDRHAQRHLARLELFPAHLRWSKSTRLWWQGG